jgi:hypothetical protein
MRVSQICQMSWEDTYDEGDFSSMEIFDAISFTRTLIERMPGWQWNRRMTGDGLI